MEEVIQQQSGDPHRFQLLFDALLDYAICMTDLNGFITSWNCGAARIKGYEQTEIIGHHFSRFFPPDDRAAGIPDKILEQARATGRCESEGWRLRKDGSRFWSNGIVQLMQDAQGAPVGFAEITRDITERRAEHEALRDSERRFRILVEGVVDYAIYMLDPSGIITNWNAGAERLKGYTAEEITGHHFSRFYSKEDRSRGLPAHILEIAAREGRFEAEGWRLRKDGSRFWASVVIDSIHDEAGQLVGYAKVTRDMTERRAAQEALRESERQFRLLVAGVTDYALFMLDPNGIVATWNAGAERIKGYKADEIIGQHFSRFYTERDRADGLPAKALRKAMQEKSFEAEGWRLRKDGSMFWANIVIDPIYDEDHELIGFAKITRDITERRDAQKALEKSEAERSHAQKLDALGNLTGGVAHDFNNLLMIVSGHLPLLKKKIDEDPKAARAIDAIETAIKRGAALTRQLLTFSRRQSFDPAVLDVRERIVSLRAMLESSVGSSIKLMVLIDSQVGAVKVDPTEFELAIVNLVVNARDAMPRGGTISLAAENVVLSRAEAGLEGQFVAVRVIDTGGGIPPDVMPKVFDPFFTTKQAQNGSGLGLSQVHGFVTQSGGAVTIDSTLGRGTTVTLYLPRTREPIGAVATSAELDRLRHGLILLVEDNPDVGQASRSLLEQIGYSVRLVANSDAALYALDEQDFELVISDIIMPQGMDGVALARIIRERKPKMPVLLITGYNPNVGVNEEFVVLRKPLDMADLSRITARLIAEANQPALSNVVRMRDRPGRV